MNIGPSPLKELTTRALRHRERMRIEDIRAPPLVIAAEHGDLVRDFDLRFINFMLDVIVFGG